MLMANNGNETERLMRLQIAITTPEARWCCSELLQLLLPVMFVIVVAALVVVLLLSSTLLKSHLLNSGVFLDNIQLATA